MAYNIENATFEDLRIWSERMKSVAGYAYVKFNDIDMSAEEFYITPLANVNANNTEPLGRCKDMAELESLAQKWATE